MKDGLVFLLMNRHYLLIEEFSSVVRGPIFVTHRAMERLRQKAAYTLPSDELLDILKSEDRTTTSRLESRLSAGRYMIAWNEAHLTLVPVRWIARISSIFQFSAPKPAEIVQEYARRRIAEFKTARREALLSNLIGRHAGLGDSLAVFAKYAFFDQASLWVYNPFTKIFTCVAAYGSLPCKEYLSEADCPAMYKLMGVSDDYGSMKPSMPVSDESMRTTIWVRLYFSPDPGGQSIRDEGTAAILVFSSCHADFGIDPDTCNYARHFFEAKYQEDRQRIERSIESIMHYYASYEPGKLNEFLGGLAREICEQLHFEGCSLFLKKDSENALELKSVCDADGYGDPTSPITYDLDEPSLTVSVFSDRELKFSYDLPTDSRHSGKSVERTAHPDKNWLGLPLTSDHRTLGVLRAKNKYRVLSDGRGTEIEHFHPMDIVTLETVCSSLATLIQTEEAYQQYVKKLAEQQGKLTEMLNACRKLNKANEELNDRIATLRHFNSVLLHEIRSPISTFNLAPEIITDLLRKAVQIINNLREKSNAVVSDDAGGVEYVRRNLAMIEEKLVTIRRKVVDINVMGERLRFITQMYYFEQLVRAQNPQRLSLLRDVVFPVLNISRAYVRKQFGIHIELRADVLGNQTIYGDKLLLNIVLNALIDNASKYTTKSDGRIVISGHRSTMNRDCFALSISNDGYEIYAEEKDRIFEEAYQGTEARLQKAPGSGTGLYLAKRIMRAQGGDLVLASMHNPVTFEVHIPTSYADIVARS